MWKSIKQLLGGIKGIKKLFDKMDKKIFDFFWRPVSAMKPTFALFNSHQS